MTANEKKILNHLATTAGGMASIAAGVDLPLYRVAFALVQLTRRSLVVEIRVGGKSTWIRGDAFAEIMRAAAAKHPVKS